MAKVDVRLKAAVAVAVAVAVVVVVAVAVVVVVAAAAAFGTGCSSLPLLAAAKATRFYSSLLRLQRLFRGTLANQFVHPAPLLHRCPAFHCVQVPPSAKNSRCVRGGGLPGGKMCEPSRRRVGPVQAASLELWEVSFVGGGQ